MKNRFVLIALAAFCVTFSTPAYSVQSEDAASQVSPDHMWEGENVDPENIGEEVEHQGHEHGIDSAADQESATLHIVDGEHGEDHGEGAHGAHGEGHNEGLPQFDPSSFPSQLFWLVVVFILLYIFFSRKTLPDISKVIDTRQEHIQNDLDSAEQLRKEAEEVQGAYEAILNEARHKSTGAYVAVEESIKRKSDKANDGFAKRSAKALDEAEGSIEKAKGDLIPELDDIAAKVAADAAQKIIGVDVDEAYAQSIVSSLQGKKKAA